MFPLPPKTQTNYTNEQLRTELRTFIEQAGSRLRQIQTSLDIIQLDARTDCESEAVPHSVEGETKSNAASDAACESASMSGRLADQTIVQTSEEQATDTSNRLQALKARLSAKSLSAQTPD